MQARIPGYEDVSFDVLSLLFSIRLYLEIVSYGTEEFAFLEDIPFVNDLYKWRITPIILADLSIIILHLILSWW